MSVIKKVSLFLFSTFLVACNSYTQDSVQANLWYRYAGEARALQYQAFNFAKLRLDVALKQTSKKPPAIIVDIDETILDNSPYSARTILTGQPYRPETWLAWVKERRATALAGALDFLQYAHRRGVTIFYISNRDAKQEVEPTYDNLRRLGFPVQRSQMLFRAGSSSKEARRESVARQYRIILLMGDNLSDFAQVFDKKSVAERNRLVDQYRNRFGYDFIVLPNPIYGDWELAFYRYASLTEAQKFVVRHQYLEAMGQ